MDYDRELVRYVNIAYRYWWLAIVCVLVAAGIAIVRERRSPEQYSATVLVASTRESMQVSFDTAISTVAEEQTSKDARAQRLAAYAELVSSQPVAEAVIAELDDQLPARFRDASALLDMVSGRVSKDSDIIQIQVLGHDKRLVVTVAEAWGPAYIAQVNQIYGSPGRDLLASIEAELKVARQDVARRQKALEDYEATGTLDIATRQATEVRSAISSVSRSRRSYFDQVARQSWRLQQHLNQARDLRDHLLLSESAPPSTSLPALTLLKTYVYALEMGDAPVVVGIDSAQPGMQLTSIGPQDSSGTTSQVSLSLHSDSPGATVQDMIADLDGLVSILEARQGRLEEELGAAARLLTGESEGSGGAGAQYDDALVTLERQLGSLEAQVTREETTRNGLIAQRDLAQETLTNLQRKAAELRLASRTMGAQVRLATTNPVVRRIPSQTLKTLALAAALGIVSSIALAAGLELVRLSRRGDEPQK